MSDSTSQSSPFERHPRITVLTLMVVAFLVFDLLASFATELILGHPLLEPLTEEELFELDPSKNYRRPSPVYHHDLMASASSDNAIWGKRVYSVHTDSLGFKSDKIKVTPLAGSKHRILFIGDSFTEGVGVEYQETFVGRIANALADEGVEVLNAAVSSYSPTIYWRKLKYLLEDVGLKIDEVVVYLDISDVVDEAKHYRLTADDTVNWVPEQRAETDAAGEKPRSIAKAIKKLMKTRLMFTYFVANTTHDFIYASEEKKLAATNNHRSRWTLHERDLKAYGREGLEIAAERMNRLYQLLVSHGIALTLAVYPWPDQIVGNDLNSIQVSYWKNWARDKQVPFLNYFPCFVKEDGGIAVLDAYFIPGDIHWNEAGHREIADGFLRFRKNKVAQDAC